MCLTLVLLLYGLFNIASGQPNCENLPRPNRTSCRGEVDFALGDDRYERIPSQCRVACERFSHPSIAVDIIKANCSFDLCDMEMPFRIFDVGTHMCQPRTVCIRACGEEPAGCVYSGTCRELTCFKDKNTGRPANLSRLTYAGPRSIVQVNDSKTSDGAPLEKFLDAFLGSRDYCSEELRPEISDPFCEPTLPSNRTFLSDNQNSESNEPFRQCRVACKGAQFDDVEIVRMRTNCGICEGDGRSEDFMCATQSECERECPASYTTTDGCVFTGGCRSLICVSGIDSRLPAIINVSNTTGFNGMIVSVNNDAEPTTEDLPVFMNFLKDIQVPNSTVLSTDSESDQDQGNEDEASTTESASKWTWLGPIVGLLGAILTAMAALGAAYVARSNINIMTGSKSMSSDGDFTS